MDFDPSEFLAMAMTEDQDAVYTAPDIQEPCPSIPDPHGVITVEGGLEMENDLQLSVPTFNGLDVDGAQMEDIEEFNQSMAVDLPFALSDGYPLNTTGINNSPSTQEHNSTAALPSPIERTASPQTGKKIQTSYEEQRFRKEFFNGNFERVKLFRLHCTICDKHLGCAPWLTERQMRMHKLLSVCVCRRCFEYYGDVNFPVEEGSDIYCCWCGEGGELFCCGSCSKAVCKKCLKRNFGSAKIKEVEENDNWCCFVCKPNDIWPHRALMWGLQRFGKQLRQQVALLSKEEKQATLSKDTSHCCPKGNEIVPHLSLPFKRIMSSVPLCLIAVPHQLAVRQLLEKQAPSNSLSTINKPMSFGNGFGGQQVSQSSSLIRTPQITQQQFAKPHLGMVSNANPVKQMLYRSAINRAASAPYPINRPVKLIVNMPHTQTIQRGTVVAQIQTPVTRTSVQPTEIIDLVDDSPPSLQTPTKSSSPNYDTSWLERGIKKVHDSLQPVNKIIDQFSFVSGDLKNDLSKIDSYFDKLSVALKTAICNLAKVNQDMIEDKKMALDNTVSSVVHEIHKSGILHSLINGHQTPSPSPIPPPSAKRAIIEPVKKDANVTQVNVTPSKPGNLMASSSADDEIGDVTPALFCEAVLEVDGNKENNSGNKAPKAPGVTTPTTPKKKKSKGRPRSRPLIRSPTNKTINVEVIDLMDDEDNGDNSDNVRERNSKKKTISDHELLKKFNIKPCKVMLERCKVKKRKIG